VLLTCYVSIIHRSAEKSIPFSQKTIKLSSFFLPPSYLFKKPDAVQFPFWVGGLDEIDQKYL